MDELVLSDIKSVSDVMNHVLSLAEEVPFGNSDWQNQHVIVNCEGSIHRAFRHATLRIINRLQALNECYFELRKKTVEIKKLERKLESETDELERELIEIEIERINSQMSYTQKLVKDAIREVNSLYPFIKKVGRLSREEFEKLEREHFIKKYQNILAGKNEVVLSLETAINEEQGLFKLIVENRLSKEEFLKIEGG